MSQGAEWTFKELIFPYIGSRPIAAIKAPEVLTLLQRIEAQGKHETEHRTKQRVSQVLRYAIATGRAEHDVTADLRGALTRVKTEHFAAITEPQGVGELLRAIDGYVGRVPPRPAVETGDCDHQGTAALHGCRQVSVPFIAYTHERPISDAILTAALRQLGYSGDEQTAHGFRTIADTFLNVLGFPPDVIRKPPYRLASWLESRAVP